MTLVYVAIAMMCLAAIFLWGCQVGLQASELEQSDMARQLEAIRNAELIALNRAGRQIVIISSCPRPAELVAILEEHGRSYVS